MPTSKSLHRRRIRPAHRPASPLPAAPAPGSSWIIPALYAAFGLGLLLVAAFVYVVLLAPSG